MVVNLVPPEQIPDIDGAKLSAIAGGLKYRDRDDLLAIEFATGTNTSAVFTQNTFAAAPVTVAKQHLSQSKPRALLVNMGNANAATGQLGIDNCLAACRTFAAAKGICVDEVLPFSTGVIGEQLAMPVLQKAIKNMTEQQADCSWIRSAAAIMTTDTVPKGVSKQFELDGELITINGIAKGSGMICPDMATMLAFMVTDAPIDQHLLDQLLVRGIAASFNRITVDSDTSTNDAVTLSATGRAKISDLSDAKDRRVSTFYNALEKLMIELATAIVRDGEGASKFIKVQVIGGHTQEDCSAVAQAVANSPLVKTALFASDPNWGRLAMAIGKANTRSVVAEKVSVSANGVVIMQAGQAHPEYTESIGQAVFSAAEIELAIDLDQGEAEYHVWTSDLSHDYVTINSDYRS